MVDAVTNEAFINDLESRLRSLIGTQIEVEISNLDPFYMKLSDMIQKDETTGTIEFKLEGVLRNPINVGLGIVGISSEYYWAIGTHTYNFGTHTPRGFISKILGDDKAVIYTISGPYQETMLPCGIAPKKIEDYRMEKGWMESRAMRIGSSIGKMADGISRKFARKGNPRVTRPSAASR